MKNILDAICNIVRVRNYEIKSHYLGRNRANNIGEALENFIKDAFAGTFEIEDEMECLKIYENVFSWLGNQNHPPDLMVKSGDAIEVKKIQSARSDIALNSSYPKSNISVTNNMITEECRACEEWNEKDLLYCVGHTTDDLLKSLWMVYGSIYAAKHETYQKIKDIISDGVNTIPDIELAETNELGRVNRVDPLGITNLRIRGMWQIQNPRRVFEYVYSPLEPQTFELVCLIPSDKYSLLNPDNNHEIDSLFNKQISISDIQVKDPNNPALLIDCKLIVFTKE